MSAKRKPRTPTPPPGMKEEADEESEDLYAGRRVSVSEFDGQDFGYESVSSPGASSTSSEPAYIRKPGFEHHAHEFRTTPPKTNAFSPTGVSAAVGGNLVCSHPIRTSLQKPTGLQSPTGSLGSKGSKKKKSSTPEARAEGSREGTGSTSTGHIRPKLKKDPLPMKMRAFPQSFWLQPNKNSLPPSCSTLPPLILGKDCSDVLEIRPVTPPEEERVGNTEHVKSEPVNGEEAELRTIKVGNPDLLSRLFDSVEQGDRKRVAVVRRGRPRKPPSTVLPRVLRDEDPCLVSTVTESILPLLPDKTPVSSGSSTPLGIRQAPQVLEMVNLRDGDRTISLPSLNVEHNYNQILSELVLKL
ncbi:uncharacterized protein LOC127006131 isoform X2 [Eriocheir sinensis]|uniref:uncharacterized protein LOC127006131 isoform X2 n=1 Tax=Eriocheir sinensis TaxID=95602 RepID=UPI0021C5EDB2|nr:uncharacterized protein LOC127006131 isoform X2 [Eriocheir sinensis]